jgi:hypothetical protein
MKRLQRLRPQRSGRRPVHERRDRERRVLLLGLAISFALHLVLLTIVGRWLRPDVVHGPVPQETAAVEPERGIRAIVLGDVEERPETEVAMEPIAPRPRLPPTQAEPAAEPATTDEATPRRRTAAERLAPRIVDPRLWRPMIVLPSEPTLEDVQDRVAHAIEMLSDSALAETERALRARDWTVEDSKGGRWGISPGQIHLGSLTLPLPLFFPTDPAAEAQQALLFELETQLERTEFLESFDARVRAIRERRDRERSEQRSGNGRGGR